MTHLNQFLEVLETKLPEVCADKNLVDNLPFIFKNPGTLHRMRARGQSPTYFFIDPNFYYLRKDVLDWLRSRYQIKIECSVPKRMEKLSEKIKKRAK